MAFNNGKIQEVSVFRTTDGLTHETIQKATDHQIGITLEEKIRGIAVKDYSYDVVDEIVEFVTRNRYMLLSIMRGEAEDGFGN